MKSEFAHVTPLHWLIACAFGAIALVAFWGGYQTGKAVAQHPSGQSQGV